MNTGAPSSVEPGARPVEQQQPPQDPIDAGAGASEEMPSNSEEEEQEEEEGTDEDEDMSDEEAHAMLSRMVQEAEAAPGVDDAIPRTESLELQDQEDLKRLKERGNHMFAAKLFSKAVEAYTDALRIARESDDIAVLASNRSAAFASLSQEYRSRPASRSEAAALFGLDPSTLAALALKDAERAVALRPGWAKAYSRQGLALFLCERYQAAAEAYLSGLSLEPGNAALQEGLAQVKSILEPGQPGQGAADPSGGAGGDDDGPAAGMAGAPGSSTSPANKRARTLGREQDDLECILCMKLLYEPVTTPCGHTFCKGCFSRAMDHARRCPMCRTVLHTGRDLPVTVTLANLLEKSFPAEYGERRAEVAEESRAGGSSGGGDSSGPYQLPLFVMSTLFPGEKMALNVFEPRYRLMVRRCMEGNRRFGLGCVGPSRAVEDVAVEVEILDCAPQPDGRYYLEIVGRRRVRLLEQSELDGYRVARVQAFQDDVPTPGSDAASQLTSLADSVAAAADALVGSVRRVASSSPARGARLRSLLEEAGEKPPVEQAEALSFWVAALAATFFTDVSTERMALLRGTDTAARLGRLRQRLSAGDGGSCCMM